MRSPSLSSPRLASLVRSVILEAATAADEAVDVRPAELRVSQDYPDYIARRSRPADVSPEKAAAIDADSDANARRSHAYVNTEKWREEVRRTYSFIDSKRGVDDVVVQPIALGGAAFDLMAGDSYDRARVLTRGEADRLFSEHGIPPLPSNSGSNSITFVPLVGAGKVISVLPETLPPLG